MSTSKNTKKQEPDEPKILFFDIETTGALLFGYRIGKQVISHKQILKYPQVICISYAWNSGKVNHLVFDIDKLDWYAKDDNSDYQVIKNFVEIANQADLLVFQNGKNFDVPFLRARIVKYNLPDIRPACVDDTYLMTKGLGFISHSLDSVGDFLGVGRKIPTDIGWWISILRGDKKTLRKMVRYCDVDVIRLRDYYNRVKSYVSSSLNRAVFAQDVTVCPKCGKRGTLKLHDANRISVKGLQRKTQFKCVACGGYITFGRNELLGKQKEYPRQAGI